MVLSVEWKRLDYVDIFRGFALFVMVSIQIFSFLWIYDIYRDYPYYVKEIDSVTWIPPSLLFTFVSGMSVYLLVMKRKDSDKSTWQIFREVVKRYGIYVLISLPFTWIMWNLNTYFAWDEAIQGIGLGAIFTAMIVLLFGKRINWAFALVPIFAFFQHFLLRHYQFASTVPADSLTIPSFLLNVSYRGWFSLINMIPLMISGIIFFKMIQENRPKIQLLMFGIGNLAVAGLLHFTIVPIDYYFRSFSYMFFAVGESSLICIALYMIYLNKNKIFEALLYPLKVFGKLSFFLYVGHYLLILKVLQITGLSDRLGEVASWMVTAVLMVFVFAVAKSYLEYKEMKKINA